MRKISLICLIIVFAVQALTAQLIKDPHKTYIPQVIPSSPLSQIFEQYVTHPITEYNGLPQIEIPLYEISLNGLTIPITLSYHAGGIKHKQYPGEVGLGWSIGTTGYRITRTVNNKPDEISHHVDISYIENLPYSSESDDANRGSYLAGLTRYAAYDGGSYTSRVKARDYDADGEYDLFTYMAPTTSSKFILDVVAGYSKGDSSMELAKLEDNRDKVYINGIEMPRDIRQNMSQRLNTFKIIDDQGNQFYFGSQDDLLIEKSYESSDVINGSYAKVTTAWVMEKAVTPFNNIINFTYDEYSLEDARPGISRKVIIYDALYYSTLSSGGGDEQQPPQGPNLDSDISPGISHWVKMVKQISTDYETITIDRERTGDARGRIKEIIVKSNVNNSQIRRVVFNYENGYDYLLSSIIIYGSDNANGKVYNFEYYSRDLTGSYYPDHWGYNMSTSKYNGFHAEFSSDQYVHAWYNDFPTIFKNSNSYLGYFNTYRKDNRIPDRLSLKRINYPTGGYTEYIYERHIYHDNIELKEIEGGGLRIKKIISNPSDGTHPIATEYRYRGGVPTFSINHRDFTDEHYILTSKYNGYSHPSYNLQVKRIYSTSPMGDLSWGLFSVNYAEVTKQEYDFDPQTGITKGYKGKTVSDYSIPGLYEFGYMEPGTGVGLLYFSNIQHPFPRYISKYNFFEKPVILKRSYFDNYDKPLQIEEYNYQETKYNKTFKGLKINQRMFCYGEHRYSYYFPEELERMQYNNPQQYASMDGHINPYSIRMDFFDYGFYEYKIHKKLLGKKIIKTYNTDGVSPVTTVEQYSYNDYNQLIYKYMVGVISSGDDLIEEYSYPSHNTELARRNMLSTIIERKIMESNNGSTIYSEYYNYPNNAILPDYVTSLNSCVELTYDKYDGKGNLLQYTGKDGIPVSYIWSYNNKYPIAKIVNKTYDKVSTALNMDMVSLAVNANPDEAIINKIKALSSTFSDALVTTYTYQPLVGMLTATDPSGITTYYDYDSFGRLKETYIYKDNIVSPANKQTVQKYEYNYKN